VARAFLAEAQALKISATLTAVATLDDDVALAQHLAPILRSNPELLYFAGTTTQLGKSFRYCLEQGYRGRLAASQGFFDIGTISVLGKLAEGLLISTSMPPLENNAAQHLELETFREQYGQITPIAAFSYAAAQIAITVIQRIGAVFRTPIIRALSEGGTIPTIVGDFRFDAFGDPVDPNLYFYTIHNAAWAYTGALRQTRFS
jgi:ABC-type branched-subunit amino acid transport system substrate-binding protein